MNNSITQISPSDCVGCGACAAVCPVEAVRMQAQKGFYRPVIDEALCIHCGKCLKSCAVAPEETQRNTPLAWYAGYMEPGKMSAHSTSGGICTALSQLYLEKGCSVYAAAFDEEWNLRQRRIESREELEQFSGSKYLQSSICAQVYAQLEEQLKASQQCLFIGTPCQVGALMAYLAAKKVPADTLLTVDFMCHGAPSPVLGKAFIAHLQKKSKKKITYYNFRSKAYGWGRIVRQVEYEDGRTKTVSGEVCPLHAWFGKHLSLRESCFACRYRTMERASDLTVADFWGLGKYYPQIPLKQGVSAVQINTEKGDRAYRQLCQERGLISQEVSRQSVWDRKTALANFPKPASYEAFWQAANQLPVEKLIKKYPPQTPKGYLKQLVKSLLGKVM